MESQSLNRVLNNLRELDLLLCDIHETIVDTHCEKQTCCQKESQKTVPNRFVYLEEFRDRFLFISPKTVSRIIKEHGINYIKLDGKMFFDPLDVIKCVLLEGPSTPYNNLMRLKDLIPELNEIVSQLIKC